MQEVNPREAFDHLYSALREYQLRFIESSLKGTGFFIICLGWGLTSERAQSFLATDPKFRLAGAIGFLLPSLAYIFLSARMLVVMRNIDRELIALDYFPRAYYSYRLMELRYAIATMIVAVAPCIVGIYLLLAPSVARNYWDHHRSDAQHETGGKQAH